jgi:hypothetical protein
VPHIRNGVELEDLLKECLFWQTVALFADFNYLSTELTVLHFHKLRPWEGFMQHVREDSQIFFDKFW